MFPQHLCEEPLRTTRGPISLAPRAQYHVTTLSGTVVQGSGSARSSITDKGLNFYPGELQILRFLSKNHAWKSLLGLLADVQRNMEFQTPLYTTKVKAKSYLLIFYLCCQQVFLETSASISKSDVAKYLIQRNSKDVGDVFSVLFKQSCHQDRCNPANMGEFCANLSAYEASSSPKNFSYSCSCKSGSETFLPEKGKCLTDQEAGVNLKGAFVSRSI